jgi:hypothetical protein
MANAIIPDAPVFWLEGKRQSPEFSAGVEAFKAFLAEADPDDVHEDPLRMFWQTPGRRGVNVSRSERILRGRRGSSDVPACRPI